MSENETSGSEASENETSENETSENEAPENELPPAPGPAGLYQPAVAHRGVVYTAGMTPRRDGGTASTSRDGGMVSPGRIGGDVDAGAARAAARLAARRALSAAAAAVGGVGRITRLLRLTVYLACVEGFTAHSDIADAASQALLDTLGERGRVARTACAVASLPGNACVEVELIAAYQEEPA